MNRIKRLLIANRGEIACRIIRSCQRMGIESVAVFSDADRHARHVQEADLACYIGPSAASESYLNAQSIMQAALKIKADAIHPGYGFLSESTQLISLCQQQGIVFVGPSLESIATMGSKIEAKAIAECLDIPTLPGYNGEHQDVATLSQQARHIGYPLLIKASAGGGGKGMRIVHTDAEFSAALQQAQKEALNAFGDDRVLLEKYLTRPRHIEVQILGDQHGNVVHLFDRECSIQRNYQKVIEEAPVSHLQYDVRQQLFECAVRLGRHLSYEGAGTVEFIVDADTQSAYFLEMNTRLQVEHPTTELVTRQDLVEWQIRVACGDCILPELERVRVQGHAIEARINAEDPANGYLPEIGRIELYREPAAQGLRVDSGVQLGSEVTPYYDSMLAKIIAFGDSRGLASQRLLHGLNNFAIGGVKTNQEFLTGLITRPAFHQELTTQYISLQYPHGWQPWGEAMHQAIACAAYALEQEHRSDLMCAGTPWQRLGSWRLTAAAGVPAQTTLWMQADKVLQRACVIGRAGHYCVQLKSATDDTPLAQFNISIYRPYSQGLSAAHSEASRQWRVELEGTHRNLDIFIRDKQVALSSPRLRRSFQFIDPEQSLLGETVAGQGGNDIRAAMPGLVTDVLVAPGERVEAGATAVVMEAMKLIHNLTCPVAGTVSQVLCIAGDKVEDGALLISVTPDAADSDDTAVEKDNTPIAEAVSH